MAARKKSRKFVRVEYSDVPKLLSKMLIAIEKAGLSFEVMKDGKPYVHLIPDPKTK